VGLFGRVLFGRVFAGRRERCMVRGPNLVRRPFEEHHPVNSNEQMGTEGEHDAPGESSRRSFLTKAAVGGAVAWSIPTVLSSPASAQGTAPLPPLLTVQNDRLSAAGTANVGGLGNTGANGQVLYVMVPVIAGVDTIVVTPSAGTGPPWVPIITGYASTGNIPGTSTPPATAGSPARIILFVWGRVGAITDTSVSVTLAGGTLPAGGRWRAGVAEFSGVGFIADGVGEGLALGSNGLTSTMITSPAITTNNNAWSVFIGGADAALGSPTTPAGYLQFDSNNFIPEHMIAGLGFVPGPIPAATSTLTAAAHTVAALITVEG